MQVDSSEKIRNVTLAGHADTGKTTLASAFLYTAGVVNRMNKVEDGNATTDFDSEEVARGYSIGLAPCFVPWRKHKVNVIDTPGAGIFGVESRAGVRATDAVILVVGTATALALVLVFALSLRLRQREIHTLFRIGGSRSTIARERS